MIYFEAVSQYSSLGKLLRIEEPRVLPYCPAIALKVILLACILQAPRLIHYHFSQSQALGQDLDSVFVALDHHYFTLGIPDIPNELSAST